MKVKDLKKGDYFTLKPCPNPRESQVYVRGDYDRCEKGYSATRFSDINFEIFLKGDREVFVDFIF